MNHSLAGRLMAGMLGCLLAAPGCISIRHERDFGTSGFAPIPSHLYCDQCVPHGFQESVSTVPCQSSDCESSDLHQSVDMPIVGVRPWVALSSAATGLKNGVGRVGSSVVGLKDRMYAHCSDWKSNRKQKANPPPWPKFHPVPSRPAFETAAGDMANTPGVFGAFGSAAVE